MAYLTGRTACVCTGIWCRHQGALTFVAGSSSVIPDSPEPSSPVSRGVFCCWWCPFRAVCLLLSYSGNPGADVESYRGANGKRLGQHNLFQYLDYPGEECAFTRLSLCLSVWSS